MHILILGAAGMVGRKLTERLLRDGRLGKQDITRMTLQDVVAPDQARHRRSRSHVVASDFADAGAAAPLIAERPDVIFHLAAIVSGEAEAEFDKGYRINLDGTRLSDRRDPQPSAAATSRGWCSRPRSRCSARRSRKRSATSSSIRR